MSMWKTAALVAALIGAAGAGAAMAPVHGQSTARVAPRAFEFFGGHGSQIGVAIRDVEPSDSKEGQAAGVVVDDVTEGSPAEQAGVRKGDIIVEFDGERVRSARQFTRVVQETVAGRKVQASVLREGQRTPLTITPREGDGFRLLEGLGRDFHVAPPALPARPMMPRELPDVDTFVWRAGNTLGIATEDMSPQLAEYFGTKTGALVTTVTPDSPAAKAGVKAGDVITSVNGEDVDGPSELRRTVQRLDPGAEFTLEVMRDRKSMSLKGKLEERRTPRRTVRSTVI